MEIRIQRHGCHRKMWKTKAKASRITQQSIKTIKRYKNNNARYQLIFYVYSWPLCTDSTMYRDKIQLKLSYSLNNYLTPLTNITDEGRKTFKNSFTLRSCNARHRTLTFTSQGDHPTATTPSEVNASHHHCAAASVMFNDCNTPRRFAWKQ